MRCTLVIARVPHVFQAWQGVSQCGLGYCRNQLANSTIGAQQSRHPEDPEPLQLQQVPHDALQLIVQAAMRQEGSTVQAWVRLSLVCKDWRAALTGALGAMSISRYRHCLCMLPLRHVPSLQKGCCRY